MCRKLLIDRLNFFTAHKLPRATAPDRQSCWARHIVEVVRSACTLFCVAVRLPLVRPIRRLPGPLAIANEQLYSNLLLDCLAVASPDEKSRPYSVLHLRSVTIIDSLFR